MVSASRQLVRASKERIGALPADLVGEVWSRMVWARPRDALSLLGKLPESVLEGIQETEWVQLWQDTSTRFPLEALTALCKLGDRAPTCLDQEMLELWRKQGPTLFSLLRDFPERLRARIAPEEIRASWLAAARQNRESAFALLLQKPAAWHQDAIRVQDVVQAATLPAGGTRVQAKLGAWEHIVPLPTLAHLPERYDGPELQALVLHAFRSGVSYGHEATNAVLVGLKLLPAHRRAAVPAAEVAHLWLDYGRLRPEPALDAIDHLAPECLAAISPADVEQIWTQAATNPRTPEIPFYYLARIPASHRAWSTPRLTAQLFEQATHARYQPHVLTALANLSPDLRAHLPEEEIQAFLGTVGPTSAREWLTRRGVAIESDPTVSREYLPEMFRTFGLGFGMEALQWLGARRRHVREAIPAEMVHEVWRAHLGDRLSPAVMLRALHWAGADVDLSSLALPGEYRRALRALQPRDLGAEIHRAVLEMLERDPASAWQQRAQLPDAHRPTITAADVRQVWGRQVEKGEHALALALLENAAPELRPDLSAEDLAPLLGSGDAAVRLAAIRLVAQVAAAPENAPPSFSARNDVAPRAMQKRTAGGRGR
jgi:hypothetical protein